MTTAVRPVFCTFGDFARQQQLEAEMTQKDTVLCVSEAAQLDAVFENITPDMRILMHRCLPSPLILRGTPNRCLPHFGTLEYLDAAVLPSTLSGDWGIEQMPCIAFGLQNSWNATVLDVRVRPAKLLRCGAVHPSTLARYVLMEEHA
jgi:hypothetical protein